MGLLLCEVLEEAERTEMVTSPSSIILFARACATKARSIWPCDHDALCVDQRDSLQDDILAILGSFHEVSGQRLKMVM